MAYIRDRVKKDGTITFKIEVCLGYEEDGTKITENTTYIPKAQTPVKARKEAEAYAKEFEDRLKNGSAYTDGEKITFKQFVKHWDENALSRKVQSGDMTKRCREDYTKILGRYVSTSIGHMKLSKIRATHIDKIVRDLIDEGKSPKTIRNVFNVINSCFEYAFRKDFIRENPCKRCEPLPKNERKTELHCFNEDQVKRFLNVALTKDYDVRIKEHTRRYTAYNGTHEEFTVHAYTEKRSVPLQFRVFFTLAIYGGFRRGELIGLDWTDVDPEERTIRIDEAVSKSDEGQYLKDPKTEAGKRTIKLPRECFELLDEWKREQRKICLELGSAWEGYRGRDYDKNPIFIQTDSGKRMCVDTPSRTFRKILKAYNKTVDEAERLPLIRLHDLRHTNASHLVASGTDIETVARRLGHSKPSFTLDVYGHALEENDEKASDVLEAIFA